MLLDEKFVSSSIEWNSTELILIIDWNTFFLLLAEARLLEEQFDVRF